MFPLRWPETDDIRFFWLILNLSPLKTPGLFLLNCSQGRLALVQLNHWEELCTNPYEIPSCQFQFLVLAHGDTENLDPDIQWRSYFSQLFITSSNSCGIGDLNRLWVGCGWVKEGLISAGLQHSSQLLSCLLHSRCSGPLPEHTRWGQPSRWQRSP